MIGRSTRLFIFAMMRAGRPAARVLGLARGSAATSASRSPVGATSRWWKPRGPRVAGEEVEELGQVLAERLAAGEQARGRA